MLLHQAGAANEQPSSRKGLLASNSSVCGWAGSSGNESAIRTIIVFQETIAISLAHFCPVKGCSRPSGKVTPPELGPVVVPSTLGS